MKLRARLWYGQMSLFLGAIVLVGCLQSVHLSAQETDEKEKATEVESDESQEMTEDEIEEMEDLSLIHI